MLRPAGFMQNLLNLFRWLFTKTLPAGRLLGIPLRVHLLFVIFVPFLAFPMFQMYSGAAYPLWLALLLALAYPGVLYGSVLAHEFGHAWGTRLVGGSTETIYLTPVGGLHMGTGSDLSPRTELLVVALGPAVSVVLAGVGIGLQAIVSGLRDNAVAQQSEGLLLTWLTALTLVGFLASINTVLAVFNLLCPLFPMDCARLIRAGFSLKYNPEMVTHRITKLGIGVGIVLMVAWLLPLPALPIIGPPSVWLGIIGFLGLQACLMEQQRLQYGQVYSNSDNWGGKTVYYDNDAMAMAKSRAREDMARVLRRRRGTTPRGPVVTRRSRPLSTFSRGKKGPAKVIDISEETAPGPQPPSPERIDDAGELNAMLKRAVKEENYELAARIKERLRELKTGGGASGKRSS